MIHGVTLNPLQEQVVAAMVRGDNYIGVRAGWGSGKTAALVLAVLYRSVLFPGESMLLITDTSSRFERVLMPEMVKWLAPLGWQYIAGRNVTGKWVDPSTNTTVWVVSYIRASTKANTHNPLEGINASAAFIDECQTLPEEVADKAFGRIRAGTSAFMMMVGLPVANAWWIRYVEARNGRTLFAISHVNRANLSEAWIRDAEHLSPAEREAMIYNRPQPPVGQVYREWSPAPYPEGNLTPAGWAYEESMEGRICGDWGLNKPWMGILVWDDAIKADVLVAEINPREVTVHELVRLILTIAWPREYADRMPSDGRRRFMLDGGSGDKAGRIRSDQTLRNIFQVMAQPPPSGRVPTGDPDEKVGIGLELRSTVQPVRVHVPNGVLKTKGRILERSLLCEQSVWFDGIGQGHDQFMIDIGARPNGNSFAKSITDYRYPDKGGEEPLKNGIEDPVDGIRYDTMNFRWYGGPQMIPPPKPPKPTPARATAAAGHPRASWRQKGVGR